MIDNKQYLSPIRINKLDNKEENDLDMIIKQNDPVRIIKETDNSDGAKEENYLDMIIKRKHDLDTNIEENNYLDNVNTEEKY